VLLFELEFRRILDRDNSLVGRDESRQDIELVVFRCPSPEISTFSFALTIPLISSPTSGVNVFSERRSSSSRGSTANRRMDKSAPSIARGG